MIIPPNFQVRRGSGTHSPIWRGSLRAPYSLSVVEKFSTAVAKFFHRGGQISPPRCGFCPRRWQFAYAGRETATAVGVSYDHPACGLKLQVQRQPHFGSVGVRVMVRVRVSLPGSGQGDV